VFDRAKRYGYCMPDLPTFEVLSDTADDQLINKTVSDLHHVLHSAQHSRCPGIKWVCWVWGPKCWRSRPERPELRGVLGEGAVNCLPTSWASGGVLQSPPVGYGAKPQKPLNFMHFETWKSHQNSARWQI